MSSSPSSPSIALSKRWHWGSKQAISFLMQQGADNPEVLSLAAGLVDPATLPCDAVREIVTEICQNPTEARYALQYNSSQGAPRLRQALVQHVASLEGRAAEDIGLTEEHIFLTTGSQQLLSLICEILFDPGDIAFVAAPTYFVFLGTLAGVGAQAVPIRSDEHGMVIEDLDRAIEQLAASGQLNRVKLIYLVSDFENPSGVCLSAERRQQVVELAKKWSREQRILILEDAAYRELRYSGSPLPSIWSFDTDHQHVLLAQTFSKSFSPGLRVGYGVVPLELISALSDRKGNEDFGSAHFNQQVIARAMESGVYDLHVQQVRTAYKIKRDAMLSAADRYFRDIPGVTWVHPDGGLYVWMTLPAHVLTSFDAPLFQYATQVENVMFVPGELCYAGAIEQRRKTQMRLSYGVLEPAMIDEAMLRLARSVRRFV